MFAGAHPRRLSTLRGLTGEDSDVAEPRNIYGGAQDRGAFSALHALYITANPGANEGVHPLQNVYEYPTLTRKGRAADAWLLSVATVDAMVFYQQIVTLRPRTNPSDLTAIFRRAADVILQEGGVVRSIANHGIRVLPYRFHSRHDLKEDDKRWFSSGRWASAYYDARPEVAARMEQQLWAEDKVLRVSTLRPSTKMDRIASTHERSNPWDMEWRRRNGIEEPLHNRRRTPPKKKW